MATRNRGTRADMLGMAATLDALNEYRKNFDVELFAAVTKTAAEVEARAKASIKRTSRGYKVGRRWVSKPGDAPNVEDGSLLNSIHTDNRRWYADVIASDYTAAWLEFGTRHMQARPFLRPALKRSNFIWRKRLREIAKTAGVKAVRKGRSRSRTK